MRVLIVSVAVCILSLAYGHYMEEVEDNLMEEKETKFFGFGLFLCVFKLKRKDEFCDNIQSWLDSTGTEIIDASTYASYIVNSLNRRCNSKRMDAEEVDPEEEEMRWFFQSFNSICRRCLNKVQEIDSSKVPANYTVLDVYSEVISEACNNTATRIDEDWY